MKHPDIDYSKFSKEQLVQLIETMVQTYDTLKIFNDELLESNKQLRNVIGSGVVDTKLAPNKRSKITDPIELERIAFNPNTPDKEAKKALGQLLKITKRK